MLKMKNILMILTIGIACIVNIWDANAQQCGITITADLMFMGDTLNCSGDAITIGADNIVIDGNGFKITGIGNGTGRGIVINNRKNITIKNLKIENFYRSVYCRDFDTLRIENVQFINNNNYAIFAGSYPTPDVWGGKNLTITNCLFDGNIHGYFGDDIEFLVIDDCTFLNNYNIAARIMGPYSHNYKIMNSYYSNNDCAIQFVYKQDTGIVKGNIVNKNGIGFYANSWDNAEVCSNSFISNSQFGIMLETYNGAPENNYFWHNNIFGNSTNVSLRNGADPLVNYFDKNGMGNYWGRGCPDELFIAGEDCNNVQLVDNYPYGQKDGWLTTEPGCISNLVLWNKLGSIDEVTNSETGVNGVVSGTVSYQDCKFGNGYVAENYNNYITFDTGTFNPNKFTIEAWLKPDWACNNGIPSEVEYTHIICNVFYSTVNKLAAGIDANGFYLSFKVNDVWQFEYWNSELLNWEAGDMIHIAFVYDRAGIAGTAYTKHLYINGVLADTSTSVPGMQANTEGIIYVGRAWENDSTYEFEGIIDNIKIYNYAKTNFSDRCSEDGNILCVPPEITLTEPDGADDVVELGENSYTITWEDEDEDSDAQISLYYDRDNDGIDGTLITNEISEDLDGTNGSYVWDMTNVDAGSYYIYTVIDDGDNIPVTNVSSGKVIKEGLIFWNKLDSIDEATNSEIGTKGKITGVVEFDSARFGNGLRPGGTDNYVSYPFENMFSTWQNRGCVELWFKAEQANDPAISEGYYLFDISDDTSLPFSLVRGLAGVGKTYFYHYIDLGSNDGPPDFLIADNILWEKGDLVHLAFIWDRDGIAGTSDTIRIYKNGELKASKAETFNPPKATASFSNLFIGICGTDKPVPSSETRNYIDNIKIHNYAKTNFLDICSEDGTTDCSVEPVGTYVAVDGNNILGDGSKEYPFRTIQKGIEAAIVLGSNNVYISEGTYQEHISMSNGVSLLGGYSQDFNDRDITLQNYRTKIDGTGNGRCIYANSIDKFTVIEGLIITNGNSSDFSGGIYCYSCNTNLIIRNNEIKNNNSQNGGGLCLNDCDMKIYGNKIIYNNTLGKGGGLCQTSGGRSRIFNNIINYNNAWNDGGGLSLTSCNAEIYNNEINGNSVRGSGSAIYMLYMLQCSIYNNQINNNIDTGSIACALFLNSESEIKLIHNTLVGNDKVAVRFNRTGETLSIMMINNIISDCDLGIRKDYNTILAGTIKNNCFYNLVNDSYYHDATTSITIRIIEDLNTMSGIESGDNIDLDPLLEEDGISLQSKSPCIEAGIDPTAYISNLTNDFFGTIRPYPDDKKYDIGAFEATNAYLTPLGTYVSTNGRDIFNDGTKEYPYRTIQRGIKAAAEIGSNAVYISEGTYKENIVMSNGISLLGGYSLDFNDRDITLDNYRTRIDGTGSGRCIFAQYINKLTIIEGIIITNGRELVFPGYGGGIYSELCGTNLIIRNNEIKNNASKYGGGIFSKYCDLRVYDNVIINNSCTAFGGGIWHQYSSLKMFNNIISNNGARDGGGLYVKFCEAEIFNNKISRNHSQIGSALNTERLNGAIYNNQIINNKANSINGSTILLVRKNGLKFINNTFVGNDKAIIYINGMNSISIITMINNIISDGDIGIKKEDTSLLTGIISNNCFYNILDNNYFYDADTEVYITNTDMLNGMSDIESGGNITADPLLDELFKPIPVASPCVDAGTDPTVYIVSMTNDYDGIKRPYPIDGEYDIGAFESTVGISIVLIQPANTITMTNIHPTFIWTATDDLFNMGVDFVIEVSDSMQFQNIIYSQNSTEDNIGYYPKLPVTKSVDIICHIPIEKFESNKVYYWRVFGKYYNGGVVKCSEIWEFRID